MYHRCFGASGRSKEFWEAFDFGGFGLLEGSKGSGRLAL